MSQPHNEQLLQLITICCDFSITFIVIFGEYFFEFVYSIVMDSSNKMKWGPFSCLTSIFFEVFFLVFVYSGESCDSDESCVSGESDDFGEADDSGNSNEFDDSSEFCDRGKGSLQN